MAIGHTQGKLSTSAALADVGLADGYAILHSSGTRTGTHYNPQLGGETALMVKERFIERYDVPLYTVGVGGSGGGIQQYLYAQNHPGLIDAPSRNTPTPTWSPRWCTSPTASCWSTTWMCWMAPTRVGLFGPTAVCWKAYTPATP